MMDDGDVVLIIGALFDMNAKIDRILNWIEGDEEEEAGEEDS